MICHYYSIRHTHTHTHTQKPRKETAMPAIKRLYLLYDDVIDKIMENELGGACGTHWGTKEMHTEF